MPFTDDDVAEVRHVVQRILVPCVFVIGLLGNSVSIYVLTRRRMRCTTNIYLTALAITDIIYLTMALLLSFQHYHYVHLYCKIYWMCYGVVVWLCDACSYISIYIAVCFTIERFIAIRYPLKRQTFCTESLAKKVIAGVTLFCLLSTVSTAFEHQYSIEYRMIDNLGQSCNQNIAKAYAIQQPIKYQQNQPEQQQQSEEIPLKSMEKFVEFVDETEGSGDSNERKFILSNNMNEMQSLALLKPETEYKSRRSVNLKQQQINALTSKTLTNIPSQSSATLTLLSAPQSLFPVEALVMEPSVTQHPVQHKALFVASTELDVPEDNFELFAMARLKTPFSTTSASSPVAALVQQMNLKTMENVINIQIPHEVLFNATDFCQNITYYNHRPTALGDDDFYINVWYFVTLFVFVLIPLCVLVTFNCFLIMLVRRSNTIRVEMTNANSIRRPKRKSTTSTVSQENRVTITLIAVVLLFIICQLPWALYLIVSSQIQIEHHLQSIFGNIFNFLAATNAAANFFLYCVLSDKYRKTIREMITGYRYKQQLTTTSLYTNGSRRSYRPATSSMVIK